jgi:hypothetical protein
VVLNVTAVSPSSTSWLQLWPGGTRPSPATSNLNFVAGQAPVPNLVIAPLSADGKVSIYNDGGSVEVLFDVMGYFPADSAYNVLSPSRILDTRSGATNVVDDRHTPLGNAESLAVQVTGRGGVPAGAKAVVLNVTAVSPSSTSWLQLWPGGTRPSPATSNLNFVAGQAPVPNLVIAPLSADGKVSIYNDGGSVEVLFDVIGYFP